MNESYTPLTRVLTALSHKEPDRVPLILLPNLHGSRELGMSIKEYFSKAENVAEGQIRLQKKYGIDCVCGFFYGPIEVEAMGGQTVYMPDGPPNSSEPVFKTIEDIKNFVSPDINQSRRLQEVLKAISILKDKVGGSIPILGVVISPFSLPVMQMGFDKYLELMYENDELMELLLNKNIEFSVAWANAQLSAGANAIVYFDPVSSSSMIPKNKFVKYGYGTAKKTISRINGPSGVHFASGKSSDAVDEMVELGFVMMSASSKESLSELKRACKNRISVIGNLDGINMRKWSEDETELIVKQAIKEAAPGGGFLLADNHGEIPYQVSDETLFAISHAARKWGKYPLDWLDN